MYVFKFVPNFTNTDKIVEFRYSANEILKRFVQHTRYIYKKYLRVREYFREKSSSRIVSNFLSFSFPFFFFFFFLLARYPRYKNMIQKNLQWRR